VAVLNRKKQTLWIDLTNVVATGLWPVHVGTPFTPGPRPQAVATTAAAHYHLIGSRNVEVAVFNRKKGTAKAQSLSY
jgi:hypothetical protein